VARVRVTKRGAAPVGVRARAPKGKYVHKRVSSPGRKGTNYITITRGGKKIRLKQVKGRTKSGRRKFKAQSVLTPRKRK
jgi:hypothetical protein